jgi:hypothetical protein
MKYKDFLINQIWNRHLLKQITEKVIEINREFLCYFSFKPIHFVHIFRLMITST